MYNYDLIYDGGIIHSEEGFETEEEAREDAEMEISMRCAYWKSEDVSYDRKLFDIEIKEN